MEKPRIGDIMVPIIILTLLLSFGSLLYVTQTSQVRDADRRYRSLREENATLQQTYADIEAARTLRSTEQATPHPTIEDRDLDVTGPHTNVSWTYAPGETERQGPKSNITYLIQVVKVMSLGRCEKPDFLQCRTGSVASFIATEATLEEKVHTSRVPPYDGASLAPGTYAWRVRAVPFGTVVRNSYSPDGMIDDEAEAAYLSDWSEYGSFSIYGSLLDRIRANKRVRVGTNLEQNTRFARLGANGPYGFDISLIHALIEGCLELRDTGGVVFNKSRACRDYLRAQLDKLRENQAKTGVPWGEPPPAQRACKSDDDQKNTPKKRGAECVDIYYVPIRKWEAWMQALRRKDIDIYIGQATASDAREGDGIHFTRGYLSFKSRLFVHKGDSAPTINQWLIHDRKIGAIGQSSNQALLDEVVKVEGRNKKAPWKIVPILFASFPGLEAAMDRGELDGVIVDETFAVGHDDWLPLDPEHYENEAWNNYINRFVGRKRGEEKIAAAVALGSDPNCASPGGESGLFCALNAALSDGGLMREYLPKLCGVFWPDNSGAAYQCKEQP